MILAATSDIPADIPELIAHWNIDSDSYDDYVEPVSDGVGRSRRGRSPSNTTPAPDKRTSRIGHIERSGYKSPEREIQKIQKDFC